MISLGTTLLALVTVAQATDYFVSSTDANRDDGGPGTEAQPWATIGKVSGRTFNAGDNIYFQRGSTWTGVQLTVSSSGNATAGRITYGAYGTGNKPVLDGNRAVPCVVITGRNYVTVQDLTLRNGLGNGLACTNGTFVNALRLDIPGSTGKGLTFSQGGNILVDGCDISDMGNAGIAILGSVPGTVRIHDVTIQNCVIHDSNPTGKSDAITLHEGPTAQDVCGANFTLRDNTTFNCREQGYDITSGSNVLLERNVSYNNLQGSLAIGHSATGVTVRYHRSTNEPVSATSSTVSIGGPNVTIEYSTFIGPANNDQPIISAAPDNPEFGLAQPSDLTLRNNVFIWNSSQPGDFFKLADHWTGAALANENLTIKNNIFASRTAALATIRFSEPDRTPGYASFAIDNNLYYQQAPNAANWRVAGTSYNFADYRSTFNRDLGGQEANPQFVNLGTGDFHLSSTASPAYNAGQDIGIATDPDGVAVPQGGARDLGAFELGVNPAAPGGLLATALTAHEIQLAWTDNAADETAFRIQRKAGTEGAYADTTPATVAANTVTFNDTNGVAGGTTYTYQVRAENSLGASAWSNEAGATTPEADTTAPEITGLTATPDHLWPANHQLVAVTLTATATDDKDPAPVTKILSVTSSEAANGQGDGNTATDWAITGDLTLNLRAERSGNGPGRLYTVTVQSTDASGNSSTAVVLIPVGHNNDTKAPTVALTAPANGALVGGNVALAAAASDNDSVVGVQFTLDGANLGVEDSSAPYGLAWNTTTVANGNHTLTAVARDENGNMATAAPVTVFVDNAPPAVAVAAPTTGSLLTGGGIVLTATATDNVAVAGVQFKIDGAALGAELTAAPYQLAWDSSTVADGSHTITAVARDMIGNTATSAAAAVTTDNLAPTVAITAPAANAVVGGANVALAAAASDLIGVAGVSFFVDGNPVGAEDTAAPYGVAWDTTAGSNGSHTLIAVARDLVGHTTESATVTVTVDNTAPTVALTAPADGATVSGSSVAVSATATDDTGVVGVRFKLDGVNLGAEDTTAPYGLVWNTTTVSPGAHTLTAVARDAAGNTGTSAPVAVTVESASTPFQMSGNQVVMEAEHATTRTAGAGAKVYNWVDVTEAGASGGAGGNAVQSQPTVPDAAVATPGPAACRADYQITVPAGSAAAFHVHVRARGANGNDDSINVSIDGNTAPFQQINLPRGATLGAWVRASGTLAIPAGTHTVTLWMRENGAVVDKLVVKDNPTLPTGTGPAESPR